MCTGLIKRNFDNLRIVGLCLCSATVWSVVTDLSMFVFSDCGRWSQTCLCLCSATVWSVTTEMSSAGLNSSRPDDVASSPGERRSLVLKRVIGGGES